MTDNCAAAFKANNTPFAKKLCIRMRMATKTGLEAEPDVTPGLCAISATLHGDAIMERLKCNSSD